ncbi:MAG: DUF4197 domain-containing protein [Pseudomonadota bacterium]
MDPRRPFLRRLGGLAAACCLPAWREAAALTETEGAQGVRAALERGALAAVSLLGRSDGFFGNPQVRIPLPPSFEKVADVLRLMGQRRKLDDLVLAMNRAAEAAVPEAKALLVQAVRSISVEDALELLRGGDTAVTDFFARKTREPLTERFMPIVTRATARVSVARKYNDIAGRAAAMGLMEPSQSKVEPYVTAKALDGLYFMIGEEERKIRRDPVGTGSAILEKVFGRW